MDMDIEQQDQDFITDLLDEFETSRSQMEVEEQIADEAEEATTEKNWKIHVETVIFPFLNANKESFRGLQSQRGPRLIVTSQSFGMQ